MSTVTFTNLDKVLWPATGFTKGDMVEYYRAVSPALLPHLEGRALTLARFPDGMDGPGWYQTNCRGAPEWMRTAEIRGRGGDLLRFCVVDDLRSLLWLANIGTVELHPFLDRLERRGEPTFVVFDLDPGPPAGAREACAVALLLRETLAGLELDAIVKTSGGKGMHVYVAIAPGHTYDATKRFARRLAADLVDNRPDLVVDRSQRSLRSGKVLVDWIQNDPGRSTAAVYSLRARPAPTVSTPLAWDEVERAAAGDDAVLRINPAGVVDRLERQGDLFRGALSGHQRLPDDEPGGG